MAIDSDFKRGAAADNGVLNDLNCRKKCGVERGYGDLTSGSNDGKENDKLNEYQKKRYYDDSPSTYKLNIDEVVDNYQLSKSAMAEIVRQRLLQFSEILKIRLRKRLMQTKIDAQSILRELERQDGSFFIPESVCNVNWDGQEYGILGDAPAIPKSGSILSSQIFENLHSIQRNVSAFIPNGGLPKLIFFAASAISIRFLLYRAMASYKPLVVIFVTFKGYEIVQLRNLANRLRRYLNILLAFEENAVDELEAESIIRKLSEALTLRHANHVSRLSKSGAQQLAEAMVQRIFLYLSRHRYGFEEDSLFWVENSLQRAFWKAERFWYRMTRPIDRERDRPRVSLMARCIRALCSESSPADYRELELESNQGQQDFTGLQQAKPMGWTAADVLCKCGVYIADERRLYGHGETNVARFSFVYGFQEEVKWRKLRPLAIGIKEESRIRPRSKM